jgi:two-component system chemotaxis sensor kinase CheA
MSLAAPRDPYKYFRIEAQEIWEALQRGALDLEKGAPAKEAAKELLRRAHTLKGAARIVGLSAVAALAHLVEEEMEPLRAGLSSPPSGLAQRLFQLLDRIAVELRAVAPAAVTTGAVLRPERAPNPGPERQRLESVRLEVAELDEVLGDQREASARLAVLRQQAAGLAQARALAQSLVEMGAQGADAWKARAMELEAWLGRFDRLSAATLEYAVRELDVAHARVGRMRLSPASALFGFLERACRDAAQALGKSVRFESSGGEQRLDASVLSGLQEVLQHAVRNAVVHGIEDPAGRLRSGKNAVGTVRVDLAVTSGRALFRCMDDGQGLDQDAIGRVARERGLLTAATALTPEAAVALVLRGGLSTSAEVTELSGRGLGMDVLRVGVERLKGRLQLQSRPGRGLELRVDVPASLSAYQVLEVRAGDLSALLPFSAVRSARLMGAAVARADGEEVVTDGAVLPMLPLDSCFGLPPGRPRFAVLLDGGDGLAALGVDRILGVRDTVMLPLPELGSFDGLALGACLDAAGDPCVILDPAGLVAAARLYQAAFQEPALSQRLPVLVVDDSLTTRMLEQNILEAAGYTVDVAASAEDALLKLKQRSYGLILTDVEMPGMNGFELLELLQGDMRLRNIPAILVTSCASLQDKRRGKAAGALDYIVKGEFDQSRLLECIRGVLG